MIYNQINKNLKLWRDTQQCNTQFINKTSNILEECDLLKIEKLIEKHQLKYSIIERNESSELCITSIVFLGSNGKECSIKSSLLELYSILDKLDNDENVNASFLVDVNIDNLDDLYTFAITIIIK